MSFREGDCEYCHAPAPAIGAMEHASTCHRPPHQSRATPPPDSGWRDAGSTPEEAKASLIDLARKVENAWAEDAARRAKCAQMREHSEVTLPPTRQKAVCSYP